MSIFEDFRRTHIEANRSTTSAHRSAAHRCPQRRSTRHRCPQRRSTRQTTRTHRSAPAPSSDGAPVARDRAHRQRSKSIGVQGRDPPRVSPAAAPPPPECDRNGARPSRGNAMRFKRSRPTNRPRFRRRGFQYRTPACFRCVNDLKIDRDLAPRSDGARCSRPLVHRASAPRTSQAGEWFAGIDRSVACPVHVARAAGRNGARHAESLPPWQRRRRQRDGRDDAPRFARAAKTVRMVVR